MKLFFLIHWKAYKWDGVLYTRSKQSAGNSVHCKFVPHHDDDDDVRYDIDGLTRVLVIINV